MMPFKNALKFCSTNWHSLTSLIGLGNLFCLMYECSKKIVTQIQICDKYLAEIRLTSST